MKKLIKNFIFKIIIILILLFFYIICILLLPKYSERIIDVGITNFGINDISPHVIREKVLNNLIKNLTEEENKIILASYKNIKKTDLPKDEYRDLIKQYPLLIEENIYVQETNNDIEIREILKNNVLSFNMNNNTIINESYNDYDANINFNQFIINEYKKIGLSLNNIQKQYIFKMGLYLFSFLTCSILSLIIIIFLSLNIQKTISKLLYTNIYNQLMLLSKKDIIENRCCDSFKGIDNNIKNIDNCFLKIIYLIYIILISPIILIRILKINIITGLILIITIIILILIFIYIFKKFKTQNININTIIDENNFNIKKIISEMYIFKKYDNVIKKVKINYLNQFKMDKKIKLITCSLDLISILIIGLVLITIIICNQKISIGTGFSIILYVIILIVSYLKIISSANKLSWMYISIKKIKKILIVKPTMVNLITKQRNVKKTSGEIIFKNVSFKYPNNFNYDLENISFVINTGEKIVITGFDNGKNIIGDLITRLYDVSNGKILVNGLDVRKTDFCILNKEISYLKENIGIINESIIFNLKMSNEKIISESIENICELVGIKNYILSKKEKYNYKLSNNISSVQKQKFLIARSIIKNPDIFIFNNAFSNIDSDVEKNIKNYLFLKTIITISKQLSDAIDADKIIVIDKGKIAGIGTHDELKNKCEVYLKIISSQLEGDES